MFVMFVMFVMFAAIALFADSQGGLVGPIMIGAKPLVPRRVGGSVVAFEKTVMELVVKVCGSNDTGIA
jgi:hypothetical protein